jgi:hypothetical protein
MVDLKEYYTKTGLGVCLVSGEDIVSHLVPQEDLNEIAKIREILYGIPEMEAGVFEIDDKKYFAIRLEDKFLVSPIHSENFGEVYNKVKKFLEEIEE